MRGKLSGGADDTADYTVKEAPLRIEYLRKAYVKAGMEEEYNAITQSEDDLLILIDLLVEHMDRPEVVYIQGATPDLKDYPAHLIIWNPSTRVGKVEFISGSRNQPQTVRTKMEEIEKGEVDVGKSQGDKYNATPIG